MIISKLHSTGKKTGNIKEFLSLSHLKYVINNKLLQR